MFNCSNLEAQDFERGELLSISKLLNELEFRRAQMILLKDEISEKDTVIEIYKTKELDFKEIIRNKDLIIKEVKPTFLENVAKYAVGIAGGLLIGLLIK